jgi:hypothetical protein
MALNTSQKIIEEMKKKTKPSRERIVANKLVKQSEQNEKLREKIISNSFWKLFRK